MADDKVGIFKRSFEFIKRHKISTAVIATAALATAYFVSRSNRKQMPTQEEMIPLEALPQPMEAGPADGRGATEWQNRVRGGAGQQQGLQPPTPSVAENAQPMGTAR